MSTPLDKAFKAAVDEKKVPGVGAVALDKSGKVLYSGAYGKTDVNDPSAPDFTTSSQLMIFSCTKLVTSVAILQLIEQGKLSLDEPIEKYVPWVKDLKVLDGFESNGSPKLRDQATKATLLNCITHTTGLTYDFFDKGTLNWRVGAKQTPVGYVAVSQFSDYQTPLAHDAGKKYTYGVNIDLLGLAIEKVTGLGLEDYFEKYVFAPLGMNRSGRLPNGKDPLLLVHFRGEDGKLEAHPEVASPKDRPDVVGGGHFMYSTLEDFTQFLLTILNNGTHPNGTKILEESTVKNYLFKDFIPQACGHNTDVGGIPSSIPQLSNEGEFMPGVEKGWSCGLLLNNEATPNGRAKGSGAWAGLANIYYWIDPAEGKLGMIGSGIFPFFDTEIMHLFDTLERQVYGKETAKTKGEKGSNHFVSRAIEVAA